MKTHLSCDLRIGFGEHVVQISGEDSCLTADFQSLSAVRRLWAEFPGDMKSLPSFIPAAAVEDAMVSVVVRGRCIATVHTKGKDVHIRRHWLAIFASVLPWS